MERNTDLFFEVMDKTPVAREAVAEKETPTTNEKDNTINKASLISYLLS